MKRRDFGASIYTNKYKDACPSPVIPFTSRDFLESEQMQVIPEAEQIRRKYEEAGGMVDKIMMDSVIMSRPPATQIIQVETIPTRIIAPPHAVPYLISNPSLVAGLSKTYLIHSGTEVISGNTQAMSVGVANYMRAHMHLNITAVTGIWDIVSQSRDPITGVWANVDTIFSNINATGAYYNNIGEMGLSTDFAVAWTPIAAGSITFSLSMTLKAGTSGSGTGLSRTIFIGNNNVTPDTGLPLFEGSDRIISLGPEVELWAIAYIPTIIKIFTL